MRTPAKILLVDDNSSNLLTLEAILGDSDYHLFPVLSGAAALELLQVHAFSVILLDVNMPHMDGFQLAAAIRKRSLTTPIIFLTAFDSDRETIEKAYALGAIDYLVKPFFPAILRAKVAAFVEFVQLRWELERRVEERTKALEASNAALQEADRRKDDFLAMLGHELRNPLAPIRGAVELLRLVDSDDKNLIKCREIIHRQVQNLSRLVDDLLDVSRITRGKIALRKDRFRIQDAVTQAIEAVQLQVKHKQQKLMVSIDAEPLYVLGDLVRLTQVFMNLLGNACKFTDPGGRITLTLAREEENAVVRVADNGIGITPDLLPRIFDLFTQGSVSAARTDGGLGIGLTLVKSLVEMHGGTVVAASQPGKGSEFVVTLPLAAISSGPATPLVQRPKASTVRRRVLVVDDNRDAANILAIQLEIDGHEVEKAFSGPEATQKALAFQPEVVFLDIGLPGMDGYEVASFIRKSAMAVPLLVAITGYGQEADKETALQRGFDAHLTKPADPVTVARIASTLRP